VSQYDLEPLDFSGLKTIPIRERGGKVRVEDFAKPYEKGGVAAWLDSLPHLLAADGFRAVIEAMEAARAAERRAQRARPPLVLVLADDVEVHRPASGRRDFGRG